MAATPRHSATDQAPGALGAYDRLVVEAAVEGRRATVEELDAVRLVGRRAAHSGVSSSDGVRQLLTDARRIWEDLPAAVRRRNREAVRHAASAVLAVLEESVAAYLDGHAGVVNELVQQEAAARRELMADLLRGSAATGHLVSRGEPFGVHVADLHQVVVARPEGVVRLPDLAAAGLERVVVEALGGHGVLVSGTDSAVVVILPGPRESAGVTVRDALAGHGVGGGWRVAVGRHHQGVHGIARSYEEALESLAFADRLGLQDSVLEPESMLIHRVLGRDRDALVDLVLSVLGPLEEARGGAAPLVETVRTYLDVGGVATVAAERLHLSVRAVTYRLARVAELTGHDPVNPDDRFTLHAAVRGAALLGWPQVQLPG
jgi:hypothetical protein